MKKKTEKKIYLFLALYESYYTIRPPKLPTRIIATIMLDYRGFNMCATTQFNKMTMLRFSPPVPLLPHPYAYSYLLLLPLSRSCVLLVVGSEIKNISMI